MAARLGLGALTVALAGALGCSTGVGDGLSGGGGGKADDLGEDAAPYAFIEVCDAVQRETRGQEDGPSYVAYGCEGGHEADWSHWSRAAVVSEGDGYSVLSVLRGVAEPHRVRLRVIEVVEVGAEEREAGAECEPFFLGSDEPCVAYEETGIEYVSTQVFNRAGARGYETTYYRTIPIARPGIFIFELEAVSPGSEEALDIQGDGSPDTWLQWVRVPREPLAAPFAGAEVRLCRAEPRAGWDGAAPSCEEVQPTAQGTLAVPALEPVWLLVELEDVTADHAIRGDCLDLGTTYVSDVIELPSLLSGWSRAWGTVYFELPRGAHQLRAQVYELGGLTYPVGTLAVVAE